MANKIKLNLKNPPIIETIKKLTVFEGFAGYGGASFALKNTGFPHEIIGYCEIDRDAVEIYTANHGDIKNYGNISLIDEKTLPDFDLFTGGFPCQPFSTAGLGQGELDLRGTLFNDIIRIVEHKKPQMVLLENVKGLLSKRHKQTFAKIISELNRIGYKTYHNVLNSLDYGIPQNRERLWIFATTNPRFDSNFNLEIPKLKLMSYVKDFLDMYPDRSLYLSNLQIARLIEKHGLDFNVDEKLCVDIYNKKIKKDGICCTLTEPHHNSIRIVEPMIGDPPEYRVRKLSPTEHFRLMGFKENEIKFSNLSYTQLCKRAGNGWDINVVERLLRKILIKL
jgi:DNA (cytosine-5)-methyltransferase 1